MIESRNDLVLRLLDEIAFLSVRLAGLRAMGMNDEILKEVERLEQASGQLDEEDRTKALRELRRVASQGETPVD